MWTAPVHDAHTGNAALPCTESPQGAHGLRWEENKALKARSGGGLCSGANLCGDDGATIRSPAREEHLGEHTVTHGHMTPDFLAVVFLVKLNFNHLVL